ncbi:hypothetical protein MNBD_GAMMA09-3216 [hydrothermal vent metagenome]|uniref:Uncharacterized protein n=1 Tax=hydrothermal vent metagenome TaxID=652676 RepID=A0A3B0YJT9_9ZZZZ
MLKTTLQLSTLVLSSFLFIACGNSDNSTTPAKDSLSVDLKLPDSLTGGGSTQQTTSKTLSQNSVSKIQQITRSAKSGTGQPCFYNGINDDEPFRNGYQTTKFMVSVMASWTCIADLLIDISTVVPHDGLIKETDNNIDNANYDADEPTHYNVIDESATQTTINMYYGYNRSSPPVTGEAPQFYISWDKQSDTDYQGRMVVNASGVNWDNRKADDPVMMRMDFNFNSTTQTADMFLQFDANNQWADGMRINITKDLTASPLDQVYLARGLINMKAQFLPVASISEIPQIQLFTASDGFGNGAAITEIQDMSLPLLLNQSTNNHLGNYLFSKKDTYFFSFDQNWEYINKTIVSAEYRGGRTTAATGGSWVPFDPSLDIIISAMPTLDADYFSGSKCTNNGDDCTTLLNAVFDFTGGFAGHEQNQGSDPADWRSSAINNAVYLSSVYPNSINWNNAFDLSFTPATVQ